MEELIKLEPTTGLKILPHWLAQPYFRVSASAGKAAKTEPKRAHGADADQELGDKNEIDGDGRRDDKRVRLMPEVISLFS